MHRLRYWPTPNTCACVASPRACWMGPACGLTVSVVRACGDSLRVDWRVYTLLNSSDTIVASVRTQHRRVPPTLHAGSHRHRHCARGCVYACVVRADARFRVGLVAGVARANESSKRMWVCRARAHARTVISTSRRARACLWCPSIHLRPPCGRACTPWARGRCARQVVGPRGWR